MNRLNMKWNIKMKKKKHHCKRESENIQYNLLNHIVERVIDQIIIF